MDITMTTLQGGAVPPRDRRLEDWIAAYRNERAANTGIYWQFDDLARQPDWLAAHRDWVEANKWGFGDRALHHMWHLVLEDLAARKRCVACLEIGVFRGQIISLWALIAAQRRFSVSIAALSPFSGSGLPVIQNRLANKLLKIVSRRFRNEAIAGNIYPDRDYLADCKRVFSQFGLDFGQVEVTRGLSTDAAMLASLEGRVFDLIYIDGDHTEEVAAQDVQNFAPKVAPGGILVMDDAALSLESDLPYRGLPGPSKAGDLLPSLGFTNILNIGHNRVFRKL